MIISKLIINIIFSYFQLYRYLILKWNLPAMSSSCRGLTHIYNQPMYNTNSFIFKILAGFSSAPNVFTPHVQTPGLLSCPVHSVQPTYTLSKDVFSITGLDCGMIYRVVPPSLPSEQLSEHCRFNLCSLTCLSVLPRFLPFSLFLV